MRSRITQLLIPMISVGVLVAFAPAPAWAAKFTPNKTIYDAGYYAGPGGITAALSASADITLPKIKCATGQTAAIDPLVGVYSSTSVPADDLQAGIRLVCTGGVPSYQPQFLVNGVRSFPALTVAKGNVIAESVTEGPASATVQLTDVTTGMTVSASGSGVLDEAYATATAEEVETAPGSGIPQAVPNFGTVTFTSAEFNGGSVGSLNWGVDAMYSGASNPPPADASLLIKPTKINGSTFKVHFVASAGPMTAPRQSVATVGAGAPNVLGG